MKFPAFKDLILYEDENVIVVNKPPFLSTIDERAGDKLNLLRMAKAYCEDAQVCHRLDKETSGCVIIAKNPDAYRHIAIQFEKRKVKKVYHAIIDGTRQFDHLTVDLPILNLGKSQVRIDRKEGKSAETIFHSLQYFKHYTLVECRPVTGRMHQIRVHLASQRTSITGDDAYGGKPLLLSTIKRGYKESKDEEQPIMKRFALHARQVSFALPGLSNTSEVSETPDVLTIEAPYPKDFATALKMLEKFDS